MQCAHCDCPLVSGPSDVSFGYVVAFGSTCFYFCKPFCVKKFLEQRVTVKGDTFSDFGTGEVPLVPYYSSKSSALARGFDIFCQAIRDMFADIARLFK